MARPSEEPKAVRDFFKYNYAANQSALVDARESYRATLVRRDSLLDRMRFGSLSLNGVTLLAGLSQVAEDFTLNPWSEGGSTAIAFFVVGIVLAMLSMQREHLHLIGLASDQGLRLDALQRIASTLEGEISSAAIERLGEELKAWAARPPKDHTLDAWGLRFMHLSAACWFVGLIVGLATA
ncbi:hypothetical protein AAG612_03050 [Citromicrobium bathyomarinum]|uniref:hypothetical protein n=1 Tax=Citromicrobium bathyomarinum TaxID=72174 RepID=UPI00315AEE9D